MDVAQSGFSIKLVVIYNFCTLIRSRENTGIDRYWMSRGIPEGEAPGDGGIKAVRPAREASQ
jgi:hypothetical protein